MKRITRYLAAGVSMAFICGLILLFGFSPKAPDPIKIQFTELNRPSMPNSDAKTGHSALNIVGIEPYMTPVHYQTHAVFFETLKQHFEGAKNKGWFNENTWVVLPEHLTTWLIAADLSSWVYEVKSTQAAMALMILQNPFQWFKSFLKSDEQDPLAAAVFRMHSTDQAKKYQSIYSELAKTYQVSIVAGSIVLENPIIENGRLITQTGQLFNVSGVFNSVGELIHLVKKHYPIVDEKTFTAAAELLDDTIQIKNVSLLPMICADSWYAPSYASILNTESESTIEKADLKMALVPSFLTGEWDAPWLGYSGYENPSDIQLSDIGSITEGEAWVKYALASKAKKFNFDMALNVFLQGQLWDMKGNGIAIAYHKEHGVLFGPNNASSRIVNLWQ